ncbi:MAG: RsmE family RNA methyltransferase, partial [bacterium]
IDLESLPRVILAQGLIKSHRWELMIEKVTELGVSRVIPVISERSRRQCQYKTERWRKISREASQQSGRSTLVEIDRPTPLERVLSLIPPDSEKIILREPDTLQPLADYPEKISLTRKPVVVLAGPEGGWSEDERQWAEQAGFMPFNINRNTLRSETAAISAVGILTFFGLGIYCNRRLFSERKEVS